MYYRLISTLLVIATCVGSNPISSSGHSQVCSGPFASNTHVFLTVSSLASVDEENLIRERYLELNWFNASPQTGDWVGLFNYDPSANISNLTSPAEKVVVSELLSSDGYYKTSVQFPRVLFTDDNNSNSSEQCIDYWIAYVRGDVVLEWNCLRTHPDWMWKRRDWLRDFSLGELMIPGTHNSGSYQRYNGKRSENIITRYKVCQDEDVRNQMIFGIRHFDLRVAYYSQLTHSFWLNHEYVRMNPLNTTINQIKMFLNATQEILLLDFHRFTVGFDGPQIHERLVSYLVEELGEWMVPRDFGVDVTCKTLWALNKRVVVFYSNPYYLQEQLLWSGLPQVWANTLDVGKLKSYFNDYMQDALRPPLWSAMAQLTPNLWSVFQQPNKGIRVLADAVNRNITFWFRQLWWQRANIVATDYFLGNQIIEVAIEANNRRKVCQNLLISELQLARNDLNDDE